MIEEQAEPVENGGHVAKSLERLSKNPQEIVPRVRFGANQRAWSLWRVKAGTGQEIVSGVQF